MIAKLPLLSLSREEECFLLHWMYDEAHCEDGVGQAKRLQLEHRAVPADIALLIAAAIPDLSVQLEASLRFPATGSPRWPWSKVALDDRLLEARRALAKNGGN